MRGGRRRRITDHSAPQTSFQLTLLTGNNTQNDVDLYIIGAIFCVASLAWYTLFRMRPSVWVLSLPWIL